MTNDNPVLAVLTRARDIFAERGGAQCMLMDHRGRVCVNGAICVASLEACGEDVSTYWSFYGHRKLTGDHGDAAITVLANEALEQYGILAVTLNNRRDTTSDQLLTLFDKAIARLEERVE